MHFIVRWNKALSCPKWEVCVTEKRGKERKILKSKFCYVIINIFYIQLHQYRPWQVNFLMLLIKTKNISFTVRNPPFLCTLSRSRSKLRVASLSIIGAMALSNGKVVFNGHWYLHLKLDHMNIVNRMMGEKNCYPARNCQYSKLVPLFSNRLGSYLWRSQPAPLTGVSCQP